MHECILAIDTSSAACSVALQFRGQIFAREALLPRRHQERLPIMVEELMEASGADKQDLSAIAFARGPGSFTGLRLAAATAQAWGMALDVPVRGVSSLAALALRGARQLETKGRVCALIKARAGEVYRGDFLWDGHAVEADGVECRMQASRVQFESLPDLLVGDGCLEVERANIRTEAALLPGAEAVLALAAHAPSCDAARALPVYLQADSAWGR